MDLNDFLVVFDNALPLENIATIIKWVNTQSEFEPGGIGKNCTIDKNIRDVQILPLNHYDGTSKTRIHWGNYLNFIIWNGMKMYEHQKCPIHGGISIEGINELSILKYETGGFYNIHSDHFGARPRTLSAIMFLNNDYEGGHLEFYDPSSKLMRDIEPVPGRLIIWPSNFMYKHKVTPVTKGKRFSIVAWAI